MKQSLSVVMPVYNEGAIIRAGVLRTHQVLEQAGIPHDFVLVDDGSCDDTWPQLTALADDLPVVRAVRLSRNFGKEGAMVAGLDRAQGDAAVLMDCDMQHPPEALPEMVRLWRNGAQVVEGKKRTRGRESLLHRWAANGFYGLLRRSSGINLRDASDFRLLDRSAIEAWKRMPERQTFFRAMSSWVGFERAQVAFDVADRAGGTSRFSLAKLLGLALHAIVSFSAAPLQLVTLAGGVLLTLFVLLGAQTLYMKAVGRAVAGFTTVILLQLIIGGILLVGLGIIGVYIAKIYEEVKGRPRYLVRADTADKEEAGDDRVR
ncbi:MAG: glycosyltransferase family 2 protein [Oscillospiraceae bacterium]|jgi:dolichol-phosphate mannosyltransferase|nr:glycosyltransferase family 2 protein [Oscillospiraceae bacterium]